MNHRRGVILLAALLMLPLIAVAITVIGAAMSAEAQRRINQTTAAQLEQMLLAGTQAARQRLGSGAVPDRSDVPLPPSLIAAAGQLRLAVVERSDRTLTLQVLADLRGKHASQRLILAKTGDRWTVLSAELEMR
jgi:hypothetical protein